MSADLNADGLVDLVFANGLTPDVTTVLGTPGGGFFAPIVSPIGSDFRDAVLCDADLDGRHDVVYITNGTLVMARGLGGGRFEVTSSIHLDGSISMLASGDLNRDGVPDFAVTSSSTNQLHIVFGNESADFSVQESIQFASRIDSVAVGDLNADGAAEVICTTQDGAHILLNSGTGTFSLEQTLPSFASSRAVRIRDINGDGAPDFAARAASAAPTASIAYGVGNGMFTLGESLPFLGLSHDGFDIGDLNGDGVVDLVGSSIISGSFGVLLSQEGGGYGELREYPGGPSPQKLLLVDLDDDGVLDVVCASNEDHFGTVHYMPEEPDSVSVCAGIGDGTFGLPQRFGVRDSTYHALMAADVDEDGGIDLITVSSDARQVCVLARRMGGCVADTSPPYGVLDTSDVLGFVQCFIGLSSEADFARPFGVFDFDDILAFLSAFGAGDCP